MTCDDLGGRVLYHTAYNPYLKHNTALWNASDFIAALTQFIPPRGRTLRSLLRPLLLPIQGALGESAPCRTGRPGWLERPACQQQPADDDHSAPQAVPQHASRSAWARLIAKVYEVEPLICPRCGSEMKVIAVITDAAEVRKTLRHLIKTGRAPPGLDPCLLP